MFLLTEGFLQHLSAIGLHDVLELLLAWSEFVEDSEMITSERRQQALDDALRCARDADTINILVAHGAEPQATKRGLMTSPWRVFKSATTVKTLEENGMFLVGDRELLPEHVGHSCPLDLVLDLLRAGADPTGALKPAIERIRPDIVSVLINQASVDIETSRISPLVAAAGRASPLLGAKGSIVEVFLDFGFDVNERCDYGYTALCRTVAQGNVPMMELLLERGADPNLCEENGWSPLHNVCLSEHPIACFEVLLEHGANPNLQDHCGRTPLDLLLSDEFVDRGDPIFSLGPVQTQIPPRLEALRNPLCREAVKLLIAHGTDIHRHSDANKRSPLQLLTRDPLGIQLVDELRQDGVILDPITELA